ncbi:hypothetical protein Hypma_003047 [Hypsizygus marmoreus]|uniref:Transmembrane protein n=1 Tax=Hypsizygus marmoreus TaxID=39966 RepID=A0A369JA02_HYPMA|nr:hypothetical protein Hypma_003047 [Hypsizygus marmoreus]
MFSKSTRTRLALVANIFLFVLHLAFFVPVFLFRCPPTMQQQTPLLHLLPILVFMDALVTCLTHHLVALGGSFLSLAWALSSCLITEVALAVFSVWVGVISLVVVALAMRALAVYVGGEANLGILWYFHVPSSWGHQAEVDEVPPASPIELVTMDSIEGGLPPPYHLG